MATSWFKKTPAATEEGLEVFQALCTKSDLGQLSRHDFNIEASKLTGYSIDQVNAGIEAELSINEPLVTYAKDLIKRNYRLACLSNGSHEWTSYAIQKHGLNALFEQVIVSSDLGIVKPDPKIYYHTLDSLQVKNAECIFVDDRSVNTDAAEKLGIKSLVFTDTVSFKSDLEALIAIN